MKKRTFVGQHVKGSGRASRRTTDPTHTSCKVAGINLKGTYNLVVNHKKPFEGLRPGHSIQGVHYWLVCLNDKYLGWAMRWDGSILARNKLEIFNRGLLPDLGKDIKITIYGKMSKRECYDWQTKIYKAGHKWFQAHNWLLPKYQRHDATAIIPYLGDVRGATILDQGSCEGQVAYALAKLGATVTATECRSAELGRDIGRYIECQDVIWLDTNKLPTGQWDIVLSLSVWHQMDPSYEQLGEHLVELRSRAKKAVYIELMAYPLKGELDVSNYMMNKQGAQLIRDYKHKVRRRRTVWKLMVTCLGRF